MARTHDHFNWILYLQEHTMFKLTFEAGHFEAGHFLQD